MMKFLPQIYLYLFSAFCLVIPFNDFGEAIPNILLATTGFFFFFAIKKHHFQKLNVTFYIFCGIILLIMVQTILLKRWEDFEMISRLLIVPAMVILSIPVKNLKIPMFAFWGGAVVLIILASINISQLYFQNGSFDFAGEEVNTIILGERPYLGFVCVSAFCLSIYNAVKRIKDNRKQGICFFVLGILFLGFIFIISARISLISISIIVLFYLLNLKNKKIRYGLLLGSAFVFSGIFMINKDLKKRFFITENSYTIQEMLKFEPRYHIWNCSFSLIKERPFTGWGFVNGQNKLQNCYAESENFINKDQQDYFVRSRFNTHSQFLNFLLSEGWFYFLLFVLFFGFSFFQYRKNSITTALFIGLFLFCLVENVLNRQMGCLLFGFVWVVSSYLALEAKESSKKKGATDTNSHS